MATYQITPEGKTEVGDGYGILDAVREGPKEDTDVAEITGRPLGEVRQYLNYFERSGWVTKSARSAVPGDQTEITDIMGFVGGVPPGLL